MDTEIHVSRDQKGVSVARVTKQKDAATEGEIAFELQSVELGSDELMEPMQSCVVISAHTNESKPKQLSEIEKLVLHALEQLIADFGASAEMKTSRQQ